ncbi:hypothetical protein NMG60_11024016 [Bertholletia excelsa]
MAEESEKRFHAIMDKLFHSPPKSKSKSTTTAPTSPPVQLPRGKKRPYMDTALSLLEPKAGIKGLQHPLVSGGSAQIPLCRPWDRGDLMRRLATFKSMTWFAKPQAVSAVNCARRGWVNVDMDTISCEACGARLLFSTPSSWTKHQVEKAALVFSLKLDNGHKLLCPWINNACDEKLAQFPPTPAEDLVAGYKERFTALLQLSALPVISPSAIDYMCSPLLEHFLRGSSAVGSSNVPEDSSQTEILGNENSSDSSLLYYQAHKLISLCGWEPRSLPYIVEYKSLQYQSAEDANMLDISHEISNGHVSSTVIYTSDVDHDAIMSNNDTVAPITVQCDPNSVVLDCRFCGASVGLWTFSTVPRPLELLRLVGCTEIDGVKGDDNYDDVRAPGAQDLGNVDVENKEGQSNAATTSSYSLHERQSNLSLTIAGGPPPTKQNFRATISLPVIGRNLRALISSNSDFRNSFQGGQNQRDGKQASDQHCNSTSNDHATCVNNDTDEQGDTLRNQPNSGILSEGIRSSKQGCPETINSIEGTPSSVDGSKKNDNFPENVEGIATDNQIVDVSSSPQVGDSSMASAVVHVTTRNEKLVGNETSVTVKANPVCGVQVDGQDGSGVKARMQTVDNDFASQIIRNPEQQLDKVMGFDPIRQHRHFCPWITSTANSPPGWQQTLSALQRQEEFSSPLPADVPSSSLIEVDDPIASIKKLFASPSEKRMKVTHHSS